MDFYTYIHCKPDMTPFYVGKGTGDRAYNLYAKGRNKWHAATIQKYGAENIHIDIITCGTEKEAFYREITVIEALRNKGVKLCNLTKGGSGGLTSTKENLSAKIRAYWTIDGNRDTHSELMKTVSSTSTFKNAVSLATKEALRGHAREAHLQGLAKANSAQTTQQRSNAQVESFKRDETRKKRHSEGATKMYLNMSDETKAKRSDKLSVINKNSWQDPVIRASRIEGMRSRNTKTK